MLPLSAVIFKTVYAQLFLGLSNLRRFVIGIVLTGVPVVLLYTGIVLRVIWVVYFGGFTLGIGSALTFLPTLGYVKYFPPYVISFYVSGLAFAGFFLSSLYLLELLVDFKLSQVGRNCRCCWGCCPFWACSCAPSCT